MAQDTPIRIGTRGSPLAMAQAREVVFRLVKAHPELHMSGKIVIESITTSGDKIARGSTSDIGGKGIFVKEIEEALLENRIDIAVHSMKDVPSSLPDGLIINCILPREDVRDVLITKTPYDITSLPYGAKVGTSSLRRKSQLLRARPDLVILPIRGNLHTRLNKVLDGYMDATLLALAGLRRVSQYQKEWTILDPSVILPAPAQGAIGLEIRASDMNTERLIKPLNCSNTHARITAERAILSLLGASCRMPVASLAELKTDKILKLRALISDPEGEIFFEAEDAGSIYDAEAIGKAVGSKLLSMSGEEFLAKL